MYLLLLKNPFAVEQEKTGKVFTDKLAAIKEGHEFIKRVVHGDALSLYLDRFSPEIQIEKLIAIEKESAQVIDLSEQKEFEVYP